MTMPRITTRANTSPAVTATSVVHKPVLLDEVMGFLRPVPGGRYLDGTLGLGGHAAALMERTKGQALLCGLDRDPEALARAGERLAPYGDNARLFHLEYARFAEALAHLGWEKVDGVLLDLGVSSMQLDVADRGFSFHADAALDMRMDMGSLPVRESALGPESWMESAKTLVNRADLLTLRNIIVRFGEDPQAGRIAKAIVEARQQEVITTTLQLADIIWNAYPAKWRATSRTHPATRTFQAIRMAVNDELGQLERFLETILPHMAVGGRLAVISFHSLEDRLVKQRFRLWARGCICPPHLPRCVCDHKPEIRELTRKPVTPGEQERAVNSRAGSAKLRVAEKIVEEQR